MGAHHVLGSPPFGANFPKSFGTYLSKIWQLLALLASRNTDCNNGSRCSLYLSWARISWGVDFGERSSNDSVCASHIPLLLNLLITNMFIRMGTKISGLRPPWHKMYQNKGKVNMDKASASTNSTWCVLASCASGSRLVPRHRQHGRWRHATSRRGSILSHVKYTTRLGDRKKHSNTREKDTSGKLMVVPLSWVYWRWES